MPQRSCENSQPPPPLKKGGVMQLQMKLSRWSTASQSLEGKRCEKDTEKSVSGPDVTHTPTETWKPAAIGRRSSSRILSSGKVSNIRQTWVFHRQMQWDAHEVGSVSWSVRFSQTYRGALFRGFAQECVQWVCIVMDQPASSCMRSAHPGSPIWGCMRNPHSGVPGANLQSPYQQAPFALHQKPDFLAYTDFSSSCLVPAAPHAAYPRDNRLYQESPGGYQRADWQFNPCETRVRAPEACPPVAPAVVSGGGSGGQELDNGVSDRLPGRVSTCLEGEYSPQSVASADSDKKSSSKRKKDITGETGGNNPDDMRKTKQNSNFGITVFLLEILLISADLWWTSI